jgi:Cu(I)/Ag(I) efflux system membrane fusion protein
VSLLAVAAAIAFYQHREHIAKLLDNLLGQGTSASLPESLYTCPMHPQIKMPQPGQCPICGMDLVKRRLGEKEQHLTLTARQIQLAAIRTETVSARRLLRTIITYGRLDYDERRLATVTARVPGRIDKLYVDFTGQRLGKDEPVLLIYSPRLITTQREYLLSLKEYQQARAANNNSLAADMKQLLEASRQRLIWWGLTDEQLNSLTTKRQISSHLVIRSPLAGTVIHKYIEEGQYVNEGTVLYRVADLSVLWAYADIYESERPLVEPGLKARIWTRSHPGRTFTGRISFIYPFLNEKTRTFTVRLEVPNPEGLLAPGMYARLKILCPIGQVLAIPESAVIRSGQRDIAFVMESPGTFAPRLVRLGRTYLELDQNHKPGTQKRRADSELAALSTGRRYHEVLAGVRAGEKVVTSGSFLLSSEAQFQGLLERLADESALARLSAPGQPQRQSTCPVMGGPIDRKIYLDYQAHRIFFCCAGCVEKFKAQPEKYLTKLREQNVLLAPAPTGEMTKTINIYRCSCTGKEWEQPAGEKKRCPFCGQAMPDCGVLVGQK